MVTFAGRQDELPNLLGSLLKLEQSMLSAYDEAVERLDGPQYQDPIRKFRMDHARTIVQLANIAELNDIHIPGKGPKDILTTGKVVLADLAGDDMILRAMESNERDMRKAYQNASGNSLTTDSLYEVCSDALRSIERHIEWYKQIH